MFRTKKSKKERKIRQKEQLYFGKGLIPFQNIHKIMQKTATFVLFIQFFQFANFVLEEFFTNVVQGLRFVSFFATVSREIADPE